MNKTSQLPRFTITLTPEQNRKLSLLSQTSFKSKAVLVREGVELLFRTPGGKQ